MAREISLALIGIGGYGEFYASAALDFAAPPAHRLVGSVDPFPESSAQLPALVARGIPVCGSLSELYSAGKVAPPDLVVVSSPIHLHCRQTVEALSHGSHVLCEKPLCVTP